jgi:hypothetical protein
VIEVDTDHGALVAAAVSGQAAVGDVDATTGYEQRPALLHRRRGDARDAGRYVDVAEPPLRSGDRIQADRHVPDRVGQLRDHHDGVGGAVVGRGAGDAERVDVAARQARERHRRAEVVAPHHLVAGDAVDGVVLRYHDLDATGHDDR